MSKRVRDIPLLASGTATVRPLVDHASGEVLNVRSFGALGDGSNDDTAAIQACIDAALGGPFPGEPTPGGNGLHARYLNKEVYFPAGKYMTSSPLYFENTAGATIRGDGKYASQIVNSSSGVNGVVMFGNGSRECHFRDLGFICTDASAEAALEITMSIITTDAGYSQIGTVVTNCLVEGALTGIRLGLESNPGGHGYAGTGREQTSETAFWDCHYVNCGTGIAGRNSNALNHSIVGGKFENCDKGIVGLSFGHIRGVHFSNSSTIDIEVIGGCPCTVRDCYSTSVNFAKISGISFDLLPWANSTFYPNLSRVYDGTNVWICSPAHTSHSSQSFVDTRTANPGLWTIQPSYSMHHFIVDPGSIKGCVHINADSGSTFHSGGGITIDNCYSSNGQLRCSASDGLHRVYIRSSRFPADYLTRQPYPGAVYVDDVHVSGPA